MKIAPLEKVTALSAFVLLGSLVFAQTDVSGAPVPIHILAQSPADTTTELQVICLFRSAPENTLHGSLTETNEKLKGLLDRIRKPDLFRGELGETLLITPPGRLGVAHPYFAPTILDGGVSKFSTGEVAEQVISGFLRAATIDKALRDDHTSSGSGILALTFLAGAKNVSSTRAGIEKAVAATAKR